MATTILWIVYISLALLILIVILYEEGLCFSAFGYALTLPLIPVVVLFVIFMAIGIFAETDYGELKLVNTTNISALKDNSEVSGAFFLGTGGVGEDQNYYYMKDTSKGKQMGKIDADEDVYLNEDNGEKPRIEHYKSEIKYQSWLSNFLFEGVKFYTFYKDEYIIYIPEDSVTTEFNVDMED